MYVDQGSTSDVSIGSPLADDLQLTDLILCEDDVDRMLMTLHVMILHLTRKK